MSPITPDPQTREDIPQLGDLACVEALGVVLGGTHAYLDIVNSIRDGLAVAGDDPRLCNMIREASLYYGVRLTCFARQLVWLDSIFGLASTATDDPRPVLPLARELGDSFIGLVSISNFAQIANIYLVSPEEIRNHIRALEDWVVAQPADRRHRARAQWLPQWPTPEDQTPR